MIRQVIFWLAGYLLVGSQLLCASETGPADGAPKPAAETGIFAGDLFTAIFTVVLFFVLVVVLRKWAWGPILSGMKKREEHIRHTIEDAESSRAEAEQALANYKEQMAKAQDEARAILEKGRSEAAVLAEEIRDGAQVEARKLREKAVEDIESAKNQALKEISQQTCEMATEMAALVIGKNLNVDDQRRLVSEAMGQIQADRSSDESGDVT
ncbi:MAG: F0F1 ATP synthase subunit B [Sedimentisphaerales bacterium]|nr:F0F1 ATP synthase subunit B [Sedimentisphaerales bacterium]